MIRRYQAVLFIVLLGASVAMGVVLWQLRDRAHQRLLTGQDSTPTKAPEVAPAEKATLLVANDADSSLLSQEQIFPLPIDPGARARFILGKLLDIYAAPNALHPVPGGSTAIEQVFLLPVPNSRNESNAALAQGRQKTQAHNWRSSTSPLRLSRGIPPALKPKA